MKKTMLTLALLMPLFMSSPLKAATAESNSAQPAAVPAATSDILGFNARGEAFSKARLKGQVTVVIYWSTSCLVCMSSLPELRANAAGWSHKPFALVTVNVDRKEKDWAAYVQLFEKVQTDSGGVISLRHAGNPALPPKLPLTVLFDTQGKLVASYAGRLAPEIWDSVADLMP